MNTRLSAKALASAFLVLMIAGATPLLVPVPINPYLSIPVACAQATGDQYALNGPRVDELLFKYYASPDASVAAIQRGEIEELSDLVRVTDIQTLTKDPNINVTFNLQTHYCYVAFNLRKDTTSEINLRKAIGQLIPREQIANQLFGGIVVTPMLYEVLPSFGKWHNPNVKTYPFNVDQAKQTLQNAGYKLGTDGKYLDPTGKPMRELHFLSPTQEEAPTSYEIVRIMADTMRSIGLNVVHEAVAFDALLTQVYTDHNFDMYFLCVSGLGRYPRWIFDFYHSSLDVPDGDNSPGVHNNELDNVLYQFRYVDTTEDQARQHMWRAEEIIADLAARVPVYSRYEIEATRKGWTGQIVTLGYGLFEPSTWAWLTVHKQGQPFGGTFTADVGGRVRTLSPMFDSGAYDQKIWNLIYESLVFTDPNGNLIPGLAASWDTQDVTLADSTLGRKITFHLNQNVTWQDSTKFTSKDVKFTYDFIMQQQIPMWISAVDQVVGVEAPDDNTVVITLKTRSFLSFVDASSVVIVPQYIWKDVGANWRQFVPSQEANPTIQGLTKEIGTGPFMLVQFKAGEFWRMVWNPLYYKRHPAKTFQIEKTSIPDSLTQGDKSDLKITVKGYTGELVTNATVTADIVLNGKTTTSLPFTHVGNGVYQASLDTTNLQPGTYSLAFTISRGQGAFKQTFALSYPVEIKAPFPLVPAAIVMVVVLVAAGYVVMRRRKPKPKA